MTLTYPDDQPEENKDPPSEPQEDKDPTSKPPEDKDPTSKAPEDINPTSQQKGTSEDSRTLTDNNRLVSVNATSESKSDAVDDDLGLYGFRISENPTIQPISSPTTNISTIGIYLINVISVNLVDQHLICFAICYFLFIYQMN